MREGLGFVPLLSKLCAKRPALSQPSPLQLALRGFMGEPNVWEVPCVAHLLDMRIFAVLIILLACHLSLFFFSRTFYAPTACHTVPAWDQLSGFSVSEAAAR